MRDAAGGGPKLDEEAVFTTQPMRRAPTRPPAGSGPRPLRPRPGTEPPRPRSPWRRLSQALRRWTLSRMRLRSKLVVALVTAALVPIFLVSAIAVTVIVSGLDRGLSHNAQQQLRVAKNLVSRAVQGLDEPAAVLAASAELSQALDQGGEAVPRWAARQLSPRGPRRLQVLDTNGATLADEVIGDEPLHEPAASELLATAGPPLSRAELLARTSTAAGVDASAAGAALEVRGELLFARAIAAVSGPGSPRAFVALTLLVDGGLVDGLRAELGSDVVVSGPSGRLVTTLRDARGARRTDLRLDGPALARVLGGGQVIGSQRFGRERYQVAIEGLAGRGGARVGALAVALERRALAATERWAIRSLVIGGLLALGLAIGFAAWWSRRLGAPLARLHRGATAVSRGQLDYRLDEPEGDEIGDLASAFNSMTRTLKENQVRLAARMREIVALHDAGRAVSSAIDLDAVARKIVEALARTFDVELVALWLVGGHAHPDTDAVEAEPDGLTSDGLLLAPRPAPSTLPPAPRPAGSQLVLGAARARRRDVGSSLALDDALAAAAPWHDLAREAMDRKESIRREPAHPATSSPPPPPSFALATPLVRKARVVGVLVATRAPSARPFSEAELNLLRTFADQAGTAVENALLYDEVRGASEELERKVRLRTGELLAINTELGRTVADLRETQAQLVLSERLAGLGMLVAGVAHEINSPAAAIRGSIDALADVLSRASRQVEAITATAPRRASAIFAFLGETAPRLAARRAPTGPAARQLSRSLATSFAELDAVRFRTAALAGQLSDLGAAPEDAAALLAAVEDERDALLPTAAALADHVFLQRTAATINSAVARIARIVGALKSYSHLDQEATRIPADLREGIESTLTLLDHSLRDIVVECKFGDVPAVPVYVDELNQVWTNLIQNAVQAMSGRGQLVIETAVEDGRAVVRVIDDGPGIPEGVMSSIFEPFFTTKPKGQGSGLGLGISRQIVLKHDGEMWCKSRPGHTCFEVRLPLELPRTAPLTEQAGQGAS